MRKVWMACVTTVWLFTAMVLATQVDSISVGFHIIPAVERPPSGARVDLSVSFGLSFRLGSRNHLELLALVDSEPSSVGTSLRLLHQATESLRTGLGMSVFWPISQDLQLGSPILGTFAHASNQSPLMTNVSADAGISFQLLTLAPFDGRWTLLPLAELPALSLSLNLQASDLVIIQPRITVQPLLIDTRLLESPWGRVSDHLLLVTTGSLFVRHLRSAPSSE